MGIPAEDVTGAATLGLRNKSVMSKLPPTADKDEQILAINRLIDHVTVTLQNKFYPIGSQYVNYTDATNPSDPSVLGFGTWVAVEGRVVVGKAAAGTFATAGATGGAETHTLTTAEMPSHTHSYQLANDAYIGGASGLFPADDLYASVNTTSAGSGNAHNNLQPYIVAYVWKRTA